ncbi:MAG: MBL fold metallo-hydrolase [Methanomicrobiales archaeon]|nr:MBL fold metallo-hydrolase [Methanomicrobiales archaeon]
MTGSEFLIKKELIIVLILSLLISSCFFVYADNTKIHMIDVGHGDAVLVQTDDSNILIDAGSDRNTTAWYLGSQNITDVHQFIVTGYSYDKTGGILEVMNRTRVHEYRDYGSYPSLESYQKVHGRIVNESIPFQPLILGDRIVVADTVFIDVLQPNNTGRYSDEAIMKITTGNITTLLMNREPAPDIILTKPVQILRVADHGSREGYDPGFISTLQPEVAVISTGKYDEPHPATVMGLKATGAQVFRTDIRGTVIVLTDGERYDLTTNRSSPYGGILSLVSVIETRPPG